MRIDSVTKKSSILQHVIPPDAIMSTQSVRPISVPRAPTEKARFSPWGWERLRDYWRESVELRNSIEPVAIAALGRRLTYIQRSTVLRFPDIVTVEFIDLGNDRSTLAIDSRARYGRSDFGVNRRRVSEWIGLLRSKSANQVKRTRSYRWRAAAPRFSTPLASTVVGLMPRKQRSTVEAVCWSPHWCCSHFRSVRHSVIAGHPPPPKTTM
jgi:uncharacterized protein DUF1499